MWNITRPGETLTTILPPVGPHNTLHFSCVVVVQSLNHVWLFVTPWTAACQTPLSSTISQSLLKFMSTEGLPCWLSGEEPTCQCRRHRRCSSIPGSERPPGGGKWQPSIVFLPGKFHRQRIWWTIDHAVSKSWTWLKQLSMHACMSMESVMLSNHLLPSSPFAFTASIFPPSICHAYLFAFSYSPWGSLSKIPGWVAISFSSGLCCVRTLYYSSLSWVALHGMAHSFIELCKLFHHDKVDSWWGFLLLFIAFSLLFYLIYKCLKLEDISEINYRQGHV